MERILVEPTSTGTDLAPLSAEEVIRERRDREQRESEERSRLWQQLDQENERLRLLKRNSLLAKINAEIPLALIRLQKAEFPWGKLLGVLTGYSDQRRWFGMRYQVLRTEELACFRIDGFTDLYVTSTGVIVKNQKINYVHGRYMWDRWHRVYTDDHLLPYNIDDFGDPILNHLLAVLKAFGE